MSRDLLSLMAHEAQLLPGPVPERIGGLAVPPGQYRLCRGEYLLRGRGFAIHYRQGEGIRFELDDETARGDMELMLYGSVRATVACINGLYPLHASAVVVKDTVMAFTGPSGSGKSTLVAALGVRGLPLYCDDTLLLDIDCSPPLCLPGHKRLKLWPDAVALTSATAMELVSQNYRKYYCTPGGGDVGRCLPLGAIIALEEGEDLALEPLRGARRVTALADDHYTAQIHQAAGGYRAEERLALLTRLAGAIPVYRFTRPVAPDCFARTTAFILDQLERDATP